MPALDLPGSSASEKGGFPPPPLGMPLILWRFIAMPSPLWCRSRAMLLTCEAAEVVPLGLSFLPILMRCRDAGQDFRTSAPLLRREVLRSEHSEMEQTARLQQAYFESTLAPCLRAVLQRKVLKIKWRLILLISRPGFKIAAAKRASIDCEVVPAGFVFEVFNSLLLSLIAKTFSRNCNRRRADFWRGSLEPLIDRVRKNSGKRNVRHAAAILQSFLLNFLNAVEQ